MSDIQTRPAADAYQLAAGDLILSRRYGWLYEVDHVTRAFIFLRPRFTNRPVPYGSINLKISKHLFAIDYRFCHVTMQEAVELAQKKRRILRGKDEAQS